MNRLIGISGLKRAGKDTLATILCQRLSHVSHMSFAGPLRAFAADAFNVTEENREEKIFGLNLTGRKVLQLVGTEIGRNVHPDFWIHSLIHRCAHMYGTERTVVISDVRFDNEAKFIKENNGVLVHVLRPQSDMNAQPLDTHISEAGISTKYIDYAITNRGTLELYEASCNIFTSWLNGNRVMRDTLETFYLESRPEF